MPRQTELPDKPVRVGAAPRRKKRSPGARVRRLVRKLLGLSKTKAPQASKAPEGPVFTHLWRAAVAATHYRNRLSIHQRNVLLFQMGKVASSALQIALVDRGINCFHCHTLRQDEEAHRLSQLFETPPNLVLAARDLTMLSQHTALNMLARWYRTSEVPPDRKLKVITLTRDPVTRFVSHLLQRVGRDVRPLVDWHRAFSGGRTDGGDLGLAAAEMFGQVARLVTEAKPSIDVEAACVKAAALASALQPRQPFIAEGVASALAPLTWFDRQFRPLFDIDVTGLPEFRTSGLAYRDLGSVEVLVVRFEDLGRNLGEVARHVGLATLDLPARNVTAEKPHAAPILEAAKAFFATELGVAFEQELRRTSYGRACGYDLKTGLSLRSTQ
jgi:hypothetical protein